jgi:hypothetical protein
MLALLVQQHEELERGDEELVKKKSAAASVRCASTSSM